MKKLVFLMAALIGGVMALRARLSPRHSTAPESVADEAGSEGASATPEQE